MSFFNSFPRKIDTGESNFPRRMHYHVSKFPYNYKSLGKTSFPRKNPRAICISRQKFPYSCFPTKSSRETLSLLFIGHFPRISTLGKQVDSSSGCNQT